MSTPIVTDDQATLDRLVRDFPLTPKSLVWIAGGFYGAQVRWFADFYKCRVWAFEPQLECFAALSKIEYPKLSLFNFGLGEKDGQFEMCKPGTDACSFITRDSHVVVPGPYLTAELADTARFIQEQKVKKVDLFLMNMEGYELLLLPYLMRTGLIARFEHLMVQFHLGWDGRELYPGIRRDLEATHELIWEFRPPAWVVWRRKHE